MGPGSPCSVWAYGQRAVAEGHGPESVLGGLPGSFLAEVLFRAQHGATYEPHLQNVMFGVS